MLTAAGLTLRRRTPVCAGFPGICALLVIAMRLLAAAHATGRTVRIGKQWRQSGEERSQQQEGEQVHQGSRKGSFSRIGASQDHSYFRSDGGGTRLRNDRKNGRRALLE